MEPQVLLFQYLFRCKEIDRLVRDIQQWARSIDVDQKDQVFIRNIVFSHIFTADIQSMGECSEDLVDTLLYSPKEFKKMLTLITYRILKKMTSSILKKPSVLFDSHQILLTVIPRGLECAQTRCLIRPYTDIGCYTAITGEVCEVSERQSIVIRYLFRCTNQNCAKYFYAKSSHPLTSCKHCCGTLAEDESGRVHIDIIFLKVVPLGSFAFPSVKVLLKGSLCTQTFALGDKIQCLGRLHFSETAIGCLHACFIEPLRIELLPQSFLLQDNFKSILLLREKLGINSFPSIFRAAFSMMTSICLMKTSLLLVVPTIEACRCLSYILSTIFGNGCKFVYPHRLFQSQKAEKQLTDLHTTGAVLIPYAETFQGQRKERFLHVISQKSLAGAELMSTIVCILYQKDDINLKEYGDFDQIIRVDCQSSNTEGLQLNGNLLNDMALEGRKKFDRVTICDNAQSFFLDYIQYSKTDGCTLNSDYLLRLSRAISAIRGSMEVTIFDASLAIYFSEEKKASLLGIETPISQYPKDTSFFIPAFSPVTTRDEDTLYNIWMDSLKRLIE